MATYKKTINSYYFNKPKEITFSEYEKMRHNLAHNPNYEIFPAKSFWQEFSGGIIFLGAAIIGMPLAIAEESLSFIPGIGIVGVILYVIFNFESMLNYHSFLKRKNAFSEEIKNAIRSTNNYNGFLQFLGIVEKQTKNNSTPLKEKIKAEKLSYNGLLKAKEIQRIALVKNDSKMMLGLSNRFEDLFNVKRVSTPNDFVQEIISMLDKQYSTNKNY